MKLLRQFLFFYFFLQKDFTHTKSTKNTKITKNTKNTKNTKRQKHKNTNKQISDYFPLRCFSGAF